jgi:hypothetical protein
MATGKHRQDKAAADGDVDAFLAALGHPARDLVVALRALVLGADASIAEGIKWNAPSFRTQEWFATTHLRAKSGIGLILHFGAKKNAIAASGVVVADPAGLLQWLARDRALIAIRDVDDLAARGPALQALLRDWIRAMP